MTDLQTAFQSLPDNIRDWLSDEKVAFLIDEINSRFNFTMENDKDEIIPHLILRLCVQDLEPRLFISELSSWLDICLDSAKTLTKELEEKILAPIADSLKTNVGVDLKLLYFINPQIVIEPRSEPREPKTAAAPPEEILLEKKELKEELKEEIAEKKEEEIKIKAEPAKPFILHEHKEPEMERQPIGSSFTYQIPFQAAPEPAQKPIKATVELPPRATPTAARVVHYTSFVTKLEKLEEKEAATETKSVQKIKIPKSRWFA